MLWASGSSWEVAGTPKEESCGFLYLSWAKEAAVILSLRGGALKGHWCRDTDPSSLGGQPDPQGQVSLTVNGLVCLPQWAIQCHLFCGNTWEHCLRRTWCWPVVSVKGQTVSLWPRGPFALSQLHGSPIGAEEQPDGV